MGNGVLVRNQAVYDMNVICFQEAHLELTTNQWSLSLCGHKVGQSFNSWPLKPFCKYTLILYLAKSVKRQHMKTFWTPGVGDKGRSEPMPIGRTVTCPR